MAIKKRPISPRQKMINLMYVILMAMLAMNVSSEVLDGFTVMESSLKRTTEQTQRENQALYDAFDRQYSSNKVKVQGVFEKAIIVKNESQKLYDFIGCIKQRIAIEADGKYGTPDNLKNKESLEATARVFFAPKKQNDSNLWKAINNYRERMMAMVNDPVRKNTICRNLSTETPKNKDNKNWTEFYFESMPAVAAITMLSKLQNDIRYVEGEVLHALMGKIGEKDVSVNRLNAFVKPLAQTVVRGNHFTAQIGLAAIDTTQIPEVFIDNKKVNLKNGNIYDIVCSQTGDFVLKGWLVTSNKAGEVIRRDFSQKYSVVDPSAIVSADLMNILYAGYDNPISISVPGVPLTAVSATIEGGSLSQTAPGKYIVRPTKVGQNVLISVFSNHSGLTQKMTQYTFIVRKLPEPAPFIEIKDENGNPDRFYGGRLGKGKLMEAMKVGAAVDDGILYVPFKVLSFEMVFFDNMGNALPLVSDGNGFSVQQKATAKGLTKGKRLYISSLTVVGPDGTKRKLKTSMEVVLR